MDQRDLFKDRLDRSKPEFNGPAYSSQHDKQRLTGQILRVANLMFDGRWRTLAEISAVTGDPQASISAQLRHLRKKKFGEYNVEKRARGARDAGLWEYRVSKQGRVDQ
jgi:hypothetical protein